MRVKTWNMSPYRRGGGQAMYWYHINCMQVPMEAIWCHGMQENHWEGVSTARDPAGDSLQRCIKPVCGVGGNWPCLPDTLVSAFDSSGLQVQPLASPLLGALRCLPHSSGWRRPCVMCNWLCRPIFRYLCIIQSRLSLTFASFLERKPGKQKVIAWHLHVFNV